jgi:hypothetical protein
VCHRLEHALAGRARAEIAVLKEREVKLVEQASFEGEIVIESDIRPTDPMTSRSVLP